MSDHEDVCLTSAGKLISSDGRDGKNYRWHGRKPLGIDGEPKVIMEVPSEGKVVKVHDLASEIEKSDAENSQVSEQGSQAGRKRRVDNSPSHGTKKRRQTKDGSAIKEKSCIHIGNSTEPNSSPDQPAVMSYDQSERGKKKA